MSDKILSQEEIDALYSAMSEGQIETSAEEVRDEEIQVYDLTSQQAKLRERFDVLDEIYDKFKALISDRLSGKLRAHIETDLISTEIGKFGKFIKGFSKPTSFNIFSMEPLEGSALLVLIDNLVFSLIDCLFGGKGKAINPGRDFTLIEQRVIRRLAVDILKDYEKSWEIVQSLSVLYIKSETNPDFVQVISPDDLVIIATFLVSSSEFTGNFYMCVPYLMIEPIKEKLSYGKRRSLRVRHAPDSRLKSILGATTLDIGVELGRCRMTIRNLLNLKEGDIIQLSSGPDDPVLVKVENIPKFTSIPGVVHGNRAVQIVAPYNPNQKE